jgi:broad specificity phosphatase PhoE
MDEGDAQAASPSSVLCEVQRIFGGAQEVEIYLIRHAESELNRDRRRIGGRSSWCELNELGRAQARVLGAYLAEQGVVFDRVCSSTAVRAVQTARGMLDGMGVWPGVLETFKEIEEQHMGQWEGADRTQTYTPELLAHLREHAWTFRPPGGGESQRDCAYRLIDWLNAQVRHAAHERVAVVTHGMVIRSFLAEVLDLDRRDVVMIHIENTSITRISPTENSWKILSRNENEHIERAGLERLTGAAMPELVRAVRAGEEE